MRRRFLAITLLLFVGCAKQPDQIPAADIGPNPYTRMSCSQLAEEEVKLDQALAALSAEQKRAASNDAFGVFLIGLPVSSMSGNDKESAIAIAKGRKNAVDQVQAARSCTPTA